VVDSSWDHVWGTRQNKTARHYLLISTLHSILLLHRPNQFYSLCVYVLCPNVINHQVNYSIKHACMNLIWQLNKVLNGAKQELKKFMYWQCQNSITCLWIYLLEPKEFSFNIIIDWLMGILMWQVFVWKFATSIDHIIYYISLVN
jgi:hypothetical protein